MSRAFQATEIDEAAYNARLEQLVVEIDALEDDAVENLRVLLEDAKKAIFSELASEPFTAEHLEEMKKEVEQEMKAFSSRYEESFILILLLAWEATAEADLEALEFLGFATATAPELSTASLGVMQGYSADLIKNLTDDAIKKINTELTLGIIGNKPLPEVIDSIGKTLDSPGVFKSIMSRAETIARTELGRVSSNARQARAEEIEKIYKRDQPGVQLYKMWLHSGKARFRPNHKRLDRKVVPLNKKFPGGLDYPHAPGLPAREVVNCGCSFVVIYPGMAAYPKK